MENGQTYRHKTWKKCSKMWPYIFHDIAVYFQVKKVSNWSLNSFMKK